ncbi:kinase-like domain-containing protein [Thamnocephalis sphaerospora]|uniref:Kinase-like domain-containing protein n=1 Tax=Thamnocephalis sphaerospora TaxID=78915 RepID=A0A4P9XI57_9FUNG|nr:kinase-like domain-containing protein [Thamnocephalis sphaerospora]|eukprot:RKP04950.1 kinase-like domain-containing protein [Thamnocephalis sphaerospora]
MATAVLLNSQLPLISATPTAASSLLNWSSQFGLDIEKWHSEEPGKRTAVVKYRSHPGILRCIKDQERYETERKVLVMVRSEFPIDRSISFQELLHNFQAYDGDYCLVTKLNKGHSLQEYTTLVGGEHKNIVAVSFITAALKALVHLHKLNIVHGNLNPENFIIKPMGRGLGEFELVLTGFEGAQIVTESKQRSILGTRGYTPPEDFAGEPVDQYKRDSWMLGATLYATLVGVPPYGFIKPKKGDKYSPVPIEDLERTMARVVDTCRNEFSLVKTGDVDLDRLMKKMLTCDVQQRLSIGAFTEDKLSQLNRKAENMKRPTTVGMLRFTRKTKQLEKDMPDWQKPPHLSLLEL